MAVNYSLTSARSMGDKNYYDGIASVQDYAICRQVMHNASKNYSSASKYLPKDKMPHVEALYAFLRVGDDRVDVAHDGFSSRLEAIEDWEETYNRAFQCCESSDPVMRAYLHTALKFNIPKEVMTPYFRAMKEDLSITRFPTFDDLLHYMYGSAIPVGRAMTYILGVQPTYTIQDAISGADSLSIAMQLSNFWRDIAEDWDRGRIYLPVEDMERFSYSEGNLASQQISQNLVDLLEFQFARTEAYYQVARQSVKMLASGNWAIMSALNIYQAILSSIRDNGYDVFTHRAGTNKLQKTRRAISAFWAVSRK